MQFRGKGKARTFFGKPFQPQPSVSVWCGCSTSWIVSSCQGRPGVQSESSALQSPERVEVIGCHSLLPTATACSLAASDHPPHPVRCLAGQANPASPEKVMDQMELRNSYNYYMMTPKRLRRRKRFSKTRTERQVENVRLDGVYLSNPSLHTDIITCLSKCYLSNGERRGLFGG